MLAYLSLPDGRDFGLVMIPEGLARAYIKYPFTRADQYVEAENRAKGAQLGMWASNSPQP